MQAAEAFQEYCALKAHFTQVKYDYFKYLGKIKNNNYENRKDKHFFFRLSRRYNDVALKDFLLSNMIDDPTRWVGHMTDERYLAWKKRIVRLPETFAGDLAYISAYVDETNCKITDLFTVVSGNHPEIVKLGCFREAIAFESFIIFMHCVPNIQVKYDSALADPVWKSVSKRIRNYMPFVEQMINTFEYDFKGAFRQAIIKNSAGLKLVV